jgi:poly(3-hydroxybutyrate) depolymerase
VVLLGLAVMPPAAGSGASAPGCAQAPAAGTSTRTITVGGAQRTYLLVVPGGIAAGASLPVIMGLHGGSGTASQAARYMALHSERPALYVYPQAPYWPEVGGIAWNVDPAGVDFPYFDALLADLKARYCVDLTRIFAAGKSNGAFMVNALACYRPGMLRAIAPVAGGGPQTSRCPQGLPSSSTAPPTAWCRCAPAATPATTGSPATATPAPPRFPQTPPPASPTPAPPSRSHGANTTAPTPGPPGPAPPSATSS